MEEKGDPQELHQTQFSDPWFSKQFEWEKEFAKISSALNEGDGQLGELGKDTSRDGEVSTDAMLCVLGSKLVPMGFVQMNCSDELVMFVNSGGEALKGLHSPANFKGDFGFHGGEVLKTDEAVTCGGDYPSIYQSARFGNFSYTFKNLSPGEYFVDLHFAEIINTNGPRGMRVFDVYIQEQKVLSEFDIYGVVGANKPLQLVDARVSILENQEMMIRFEGIRGSPVVCGICIRKAPKLSATIEKSEYLVCTSCAAEIKVPSVQNSLRCTKDLAKYEKKIEELNAEIQHKTNECYEAWMSLTAANDQLEKVRMELHTKLFQADSLDRTVEIQAEQLKDIYSKYDRDKKFWAIAVEDLEQKIKVMRKEQSQLSAEAHDCANSIPELHNMIFAVQTLVTQCQDLKIKYSEEMAKRKKLYNQVLEAKGNIRVFCRCRPLSKEEVANGCASVVDFDSSKDGDLGILTNSGPSKKIFKFDRVFTPKDDQVDVFADASPLVVSVLDGYNVCIFAYGQTGTGKTFTMEGTERNRGVNYRTLEELFKVANERKDTFSYQISVSVLEVYNEQIRDLLATSPSSKKLEIRQAGEGSHHVPGIVEAKVENIKEVWNVLQAGSNARAVGSNNVNEHSSRSHCMLCIMVRARNLMNGECTKSKLWLVDLAGSERLTKTEVQGDRLKEAQNINRSLSALGDVISALATKSSHIPYRNSKLTHLLQDSLGGESKTLMLVQISPSEHDLGETISSLNFATRVRGVEFGPAKKQIDLSGDVQKLKQMLDKAKQENRSKEECIKKLEENCQNLEGKLRSRDQLSRSQMDKFKELESLLEQRTETQSQSERQHQQLLEKLKGREEKVKELENKLREQQYRESLKLNQKIEEIEQRLREQHDLENMTLQQKVRELEAKLREQQQQPEALILHQKVMELESKLKEREKQLESLILQPTDKMISNLNNNVATSANILRSSNLINQPMMMNPGSLLLRGAEPLHEARRKGDRRSAGNEFENRPSLVLLPSPPGTLLDKKVAAGLCSEANRPRQVDFRKSLGRLTRTVKPVTTVSNNTKLFGHSRVAREQVGGGLKEKDKTRVWSR
ncbi:kinesin-like protein KIN-14R isoform X2 [Aristolochia californica]|uniref:kinesin-like protein KIN-14R isoform X2 n=1 Tax=Aristolochia californica TaxID=171875 RepID=UPI0035DD340D